MHDFILECGAVRLIAFSPSDLELVQDLHFEARLDQYSSPDPVCKTAEDADRFLSEIAQSQKSHGFSRWKAVSSDGSFCGWAGFAAYEETSEIELSYCLSEDVLSRNPDLPKRLCKTLVDWFFENTYFSHLVAMVRTDNKAARDVLHEVGFAYRESRRVYGLPCDLFQLLSPAMQSYVLSA